MSPEEELRAGQGRRRYYHWALALKAALGFPPSAYQELDEASLEERYWARCSAEVEVDRYYSLVSFVEVSSADSLHRVPRRSI